MDIQCVLGEGPLWHPLEHKLYWVDIAMGRLFRYDPATHGHEQVYEGDPIGGFTIQADGSLLLFMAQGAIRSWRDGELASITGPDPDQRGFRFNDAIADPRGRVFSGTMAFRKGWSRRLRRIIRNQAETPGCLYRISTDGALTKVVERIGRPNGMGFSPDHTSMYVTDSAAGIVYAYDYDVETGSIRDGRELLRIPAGTGTPDGLTVDAAGGIWSARWNGGCIVRYAPDGTETACVELPARKVTSVTFGGADYADLYITTAGGNNRSVEGPGAGALFRLRPESRGVPEHLSRIARQVGP